MFFFLDFSHSTALDVLFPLVLPCSCHCITQIHQNWYNHFLLVEIGLRPLSSYHGHCFREHCRTHTPHLCISVTESLRARNAKSKGINVLNSDLENLYFDSCFCIARLGVGRRNPANQGKCLPQKPAQALPRCRGPHGKPWSSPPGETALGMFFPEYGIIYFFPFWFRI